MNPNNNQSSINYPCNDNATGYHRPPLPRSFKHACHGIRVYGPFSSLLIAYRGPNPTSHGKQRYEAFGELSWDCLRLSKDSLLGLSRVWSNSRARVLSRVQGNQTRTASHERVDYGAFSVLSIALINHSCDPILGLFILASVGGNSHALTLAIIRRNQIRILFVLDSTQSLFLGLITTHQSRVKLNVPYTVTTGTCGHRWPFCNA